jgi:hypothetical protein
MDGHWKNSDTLPNIDLSNCSPAQHWKNSDTLPNIDLSNCSPAHMDTGKYFGPSRNIDLSNSSLAYTVGAFEDWLVFCAKI